MNKTLKIVTILLMIILIITLNISTVYALKTTKVKIDSSGNKVETPIADDDLDTSQNVTGENADLQNMYIDITSGKLEVNGLAEDSDDVIWTKVFEKYKTFIIGFSGVGTLTCLLAFILCFMKLGTSAGNPQARTAAMTGCLVTGIGTALLGATSIIFGFFFNAI